MFCYQCEETARGTGCMTKGVCGKDHETAGLQDVLIYLCKGIAVRSGAAGGNDEARAFITDALFATLTNVNFDAARFREMIDRALAIRDSLPPAGGDEPDACTWTPKDDGAIAARRGRLRSPPTPQTTSGRSPTCWSSA